MLLALVVVGESNSWFSGYTEPVECGSGSCPAREVISSSVAVAVFWVSDVRIWLQRAASRLIRLFWSVSDHDFSDVGHESDATVGDRMFGDSADCAEEVEEIREIADGEKGHAVEERLDVGDAERDADAGGADLCGTTFLDSLETLALVDEPDVDAEDGC